jgi:hypothetical protein
VTFCIFPVRFFFSRCSLKVLIHQCFLGSCSNVCM